MGDFNTLPQTGILHLCQERYIDLELKVQTLNCLNVWSTHVYSVTELNCHSFRILVKGCFPWICWQFFSYFNLPMYGCDKGHNDSDPRVHINTLLCMVDVMYNWRNLKMKLWSRTKSLNIREICDCTQYVLLSLVEVHWGNITDPDFFLLNVIR